MTPSYTKTKQFTDWLNKIKPGFEIKSDCINYAIKAELGSKPVEYINIRRDYLDLVISKKIVDKDNIIEIYPTITTDTLHSILWELLQPHVNLYNQLIARYFFKSSLLPDNYGAIQPSRWELNPDEVLEDIMNTYKKNNNRTP